MAIDPVCGMAVPIDDGPHFSYHGTTWRFCSASCREAFKANPASFIEE